MLSETYAKSRFRTNRCRPRPKKAATLIIYQVIRTDIVNLAGVRMIQRRNGLRLALEALAEPSSRDFDRHVALQTRASGSVYFAHSTRADGYK